MESQFEREWIAGCRLVDREADQVKMAADPRDKRFTSDRNRLEACDLRKEAREADQVMLRCARSPNRTSQNIQ